MGECLAHVDDLWPGHVRGSASLPATHQPMHWQAASYRLYM